MRRTKIICTLGPASESPAMVASLIRAGMNAARLNFSHGTHVNHARLIRTVRAAARTAGEPVAIIADLQGPKIRLGVLPAEGVEIVRGQDIVLSTSATTYRDGVFPVTYRRLHREVSAGHRMLIDDGACEVEVTGVIGTRIRAAVRTGGRLISHKGMNFPDSSLRVRSLTQKDKDDLAFALARGADWIAISFVTSAKDVAGLRRLIRASARPGTRILAKIETRGALERFDEILASADGILIARGDLALETPAEDVPIRQKEMVEKCRRAGKPVIVATQMLDSMIRNPRPTRAEVSDVANAVCDHADALMLSGETAAGRYPRQAVAVMARTIEETEASPFDDVRMGSDERNLAALEEFSNAIKSLALAGQIHGVLADASVGVWSERLLVSRAEVPLFLACRDERTMRQANLRWGVRPVLVKTNHRDFFVPAIKELARRRWTKKGMRLAVVTGGEREMGFDVIEV